MEEFPSIQKIHQDFAAKGLTVLAITSDEDASIKRVKESKKVTFAILKDPDDKVADKYKVSGIPRTLIVGRDGIVKVDIDGGEEYDKFVEALKKVGL